MKQTELEGASDIPESTSNPSSVQVPSSGKIRTVAPAQEITGAPTTPISGPTATPPVPPNRDPDLGVGQPEQSSFVFALGRVEPRFPTLAAEKEFAQAIGQADTAGLPDRQAFQSVLAERRNRYLVRQLCWVLTIEGLDTYILVPREPGDFESLVEAVRPAPQPADVDVVIGVRGPIAPPQLCNGLTVPIVAFDQIYSFDTHALIRGIPRPEQMAAEQFEPAAEELFYRIMQIADNAGATDEHRALNYLAVRHPAIYATTADRFAQNNSLASVDVRPSRLSGVRRIVDVVLSYRNRQTDVVEKYFVRVDVTEEFPFLVTKMSPYYDR